MHRSLVHRRPDVGEDNPGQFADYAQIFTRAHISKAEAHLADTIADLLVESGKYPHREFNLMHSSWLG
jgi:hypothetical protein